jgi:hypothetical protein
MLAGAAVFLATSTFAADRPSTTKWLEYMNHAHCYQIRYPAEATRDTTHSLVTFIFRRLAKSTFKGEPDYENEYGFRVLTKPNPRGLGPARWIAYLDSLEGPRTSPSPEDPHPFLDAITQRRRTTIDGRRAVTVRALGGDETMEYTYVAGRGSMYEISFPVSAAPQREGFDSLKVIFNKMLRSFTLTDCR